MRVDELCEAKQPSTVKVCALTSAKAKVFRATAHHSGHKVPKIDMKRATFACHDFGVCPFYCSWILKDGAAGRVWELESITGHNTACSSAGLQRRVGPMHLS